MSNAFYSAKVRWEKGERCFPEVIANGLLQGSNIKRKLAKEFGTSEYTISRWASGASKPHPKVQSLAIQIIFDIIEGI